jgi:spore coat protein U-like protein
LISGITVFRIQEFSMLKSSLLSLSTLAALAIGSVSFAGSVNGTLPVTSSVVSACSITAAPSSTLSYDSVANAASPSNDGGSAIQVLCTKGASFTIALDQGKNAYPGQGGNAASTCDAPRRQMKSAAGNTLFYDIARTSDYAMPFGCGTKNKVSGTSASGLTPGTYMRYVTIAAGQDVPAGSYTDQVTATVTF